MSVKIGTFGGEISSQTSTILNEIHDFTGFAPFLPSDILVNKGCVEVILDDTMTKTVNVSLEQLQETLKELEEELEYLKKLRDSLASSKEIDQAEFGEISKEIERLEEKIKRIKHIIAKMVAAGIDSYPISVSLLGYYKRRPNPEIHLMMGSLGNDYELTAIVFVHELMHAYFDWHDKDITRPDCPVIEEPIAEYGMLSFMEIFERINPKYSGILDRAKKHVGKKKYELGICHYGYGRYLYSDKSHFGADWVTLFHVSCPTIDIGSAETKAYESMLSEIKYPRFERVCEDKLYDILKPRRFNFPAVARTYSDGRCYIYPILEDGDKVGFHRIYPLINPVDIKLTFEKKGGITITGTASFYKDHSTQKARINIRKIPYIATFGFGTKRFSLYEKVHSDGKAPAEWVAHEV